VQGTTLVAIWETPLPVVVKCNVDCALFNNNFITAYSLYFRDSRGNFLLSVSNHGVLSASSTEVETISLHETIKILQPVISEFDCKIMVDVVNSNNTLLNELGDVLF